MTRDIAHQQQQSVNNPLNQPKEIFQHQAVNSVPEIQSENEGKDYQLNPYEPSTHYSFLHIPLSAETQATLQYKENPLEAQSDQIGTAQPTVNYRQLAHGVIQRAKKQAPREQRINAVTTVMHARVGPRPAADGDGILAFHPRTYDEGWDYTLTVQYSLPDPVSGGQLQVRAHVHYAQDDDDSFTAGPGNYWIAGGEVKGWYKSTPMWVVDQFNATPSLERRTAAVDYYNANHPDKTFDVV